MAAFSERLRAAGLDVGLSSATRFGQALAVCEPRHLSSLYWVARSCLLHSRADIEVFNEVFAAVFSIEGLPVAPQRREAGRHSVKASGTVTRRVWPDEAAPGSIGSTSQPVIVDSYVPDLDDSDAVGLPELLPSAVAEFGDTPFEHLSKAELRQVEQWLAEAAPRLPTRQSRRYRPAAHSGQIDLRRTLLAARSTGGEPIVLARRQPKVRQRKIAVVADMSGSMQAYSRIYLHLMRALAVNANAEVFAFSTSLRRVTSQLRHSNPQVAIDRLTNEVADRFGGTKIASGIGELVASPIWSSALRGAVVLIVSDGWDADPPDQLGRRMQRLHRMAHRVLWVNPRTAAVDFEPTVGGMAAALPHTDQLLSGHTPNAMVAVIEALGSS